MLLYDAALIVPFVAVTLALIFYFSLLMKLKPSTEIKLSTYLEETIKEKPLRKGKKVSQAVESVESPAKDEVEERGCPHYVGYLTTLPKGTPFPDECFGCRKVIQCLRIEPTKVIESFYMTPVETGQT